MIKKAFNADEVIILGTRRQPDLMFHIDQSFVFLDDGKVALARIVDLGDSDKVTGYGLVDTAKNSPETSYEPPPKLEDYRIIGAKEALDFYNSIFKVLGFDVVYLDTTADNLLKFQSYTNLIVYRDKNTGKKHIILPYYAETIEQDILWQKNAETLMSEGFIVQGVMDQTAEFKGNIHCVSGLLSGVCELDTSRLES